MDRDEAFGAGGEDRLGWALLAGLLLLAAAANLAWLRMNRAPQGWDESIHLLSALDLRHALARGPLAVAGTFLTRNSYYPPLVSLLGALAGGPGRFTAVMVLFQCLLLGSLFLYARGEADPLSASLAASLALIYPPLYSQGHLFMLDMPLTAMFCLCLLLLRRSGEGKSLPFSLALGLAMGLAMLVKWSFAVYFALPWLWAFFRDRDARARRNLGLSLLAAALVAGPWYLWNLIPMSRDLFFFAFKRGAEEGQPAVFSLAGLTYYARILPAQLGRWPFWLFAISLPFGIRHPKYRRWLLWVLVPSLAFTLLHNKKDRYFMPLLPLVALMSAHLLHQAARGERRRLLAALGVFLCASQYLWANFPLSPSWPGQDRPLRRDWAMDRVFGEIRSLEKPGDSPSLVVVPDFQRMNNLNYGFFSRAYFPEVRVGGIFNFPLFADYVLAKTGDQGPSFSDAGERKDILERLLDPGSEISRIYARVAEFPLPDGSQALLFRRRDPIPVDDARFRADVRKFLRQALSHYLKGEKGLKVNLKLKKGDARIEELDAGFESGEVGDYQHKPAGLEMGPVRLEIRDILLNPWALDQGRLQLLSLGAIRVVSIRIRASDLQAFLESQAKGVEDLKVSLEDGQVGASARVRGIPVSVRASLENLDPAHPNLWVKVTRARVGFLPLPAWLFNYAIKDFNPLLNPDQAPVKLRFRKILIQNGELTIF